MEVGRGDVAAGVKFRKVSMVMSELTRVPGRLVRQGEGLPAPAEGPRLLPQDEHRQGPAFLDQNHFSGHVGEVH